MAKKAASGSGSIRKRADGRWEARYSYTDSMGCPKRGSVYGKTQKEARQKLADIVKRIDEGSYSKPKAYTVAIWMEEWLETYGQSWKPKTISDYQAKNRRYITPVLGKIKLSALTPMKVQRFINGLSGGWEGQKPLSPKSVSNVHGVLSSALKQAVVNGLIPTNPAQNVNLPKIQKPELKPLMDDALTAFLRAIQGDAYEWLFIIDLFSGLRQSELLGLKWEDISFETGEVTVRRQLQKDPDGPEYRFIDSPKNSKPRVVTLPASVMSVVRLVRQRQLEWQLKAGELWDNKDGLVFTNELGEHLKHKTVYNHFKKHVREIGMSDTRFHDLRHSCAILALQSGASVKAVQEQLGHYSSAFTMDVYGAVSKKMRSDLQERMEDAFKEAVGGK